LLTVVGEDEVKPSARSLGRQNRYFSYFGQPRRRLKTTVKLQSSVAAQLIRLDFENA
jgi:bifunctional ADP-heptose synthase (sugar kinase/adenylyltransferase)